MSTQTVYEHIQKQLGAVDKEVGTLLSELDRLRRREIDLMKENAMLAKARDAFIEQCRQKDEELARRRSR